MHTLSLSLSLVSKADRRFERGVDEVIGEMEAEEYCSMV